MRDVAYEPFTCPTCGKSSDVHPTMDVSDAKTIFLCQDRAAKWQRVEPGTVIPAGQPYMVEYENAANGMTRAEYVRPHDKQAGVRTSLPGPEWVLASREAAWFVDSSWKPPLVLPTEPTWGIAVSTAGYSVVGQWSFDRGHREFYSQHFYRWRLERVADFIPLTPEQVARIEAAR